MFFDGFTLDTVDCGEVSLRVRHGGSGPPVVLLHGHPRTHATWHRVAALLADRHTVICSDLRGYGRSTVPPDEPDHAQASKRAMANDVVSLMDALGHERFAVAGHDRGAYAAFQTAMGHPDRVVALTTMGRGVPLIEAVTRIDGRFARDWWHWFFLGQTDKPAEDVIAAIGPDAWYVPHGPEVMGPEAHEDLWTALRDPAVVHGMCEDYRAGLAIDVEHAEADRAAGRRIRCPVQSLWAAREDAGLFGDDPLELWRGWADDLRGAEIDSGHHMAEEAPEETAAALAAFWAEVV
ncbi:MAG: haloacetate dehalogenase [Solirubrobacteraceae bacterium]|nr:haloacetate dehalogenase [Solirubrobacteraceae bacterium]